MSKNTQHRQRTTLAAPLSASLLAALTLLTGCGGGGAGNQAPMASDYLIPLAKLAGTWERKCVLPPIFMLGAADANGNRTAKSTRADHYLTFVQDGNKLNATHKWVVYDYSDVQCSGAAVLTLLTSAANLNNQTGTTERGGTISINKGAETWDAIGSALFSSGQTTLGLDHFKLTYPGLFTESPNWPQAPSISFFYQSGDFLFPPKLAGEGYGVISLSMENVRDASGALTGEKQELLNFGTNTTPVTLDSAISLFSKGYSPGFGFQRVSP